MNLVVHKSNTRLHADLSGVVKHQVPLVIASVGAPDPVIEPVPAYGGRVMGRPASPLRLLLPHRRHRAPGIRCRERFSKFSIPREVRRLAIS